jgi:hypothetical protein
LKLKITDFLALPHLELDLQAPINLFAGPNEAGKSSLRDAILWCLTGSCRGLKTHQEQAYLIREGGKAAEVILTLPDGRTITRRKTPKSPPTVDGELPGDQTLITALSDPLAFLSWPEKERREMLFRLIPGLNPTIGQVTERLQSVMPPESQDVEAVKSLATLAACQGFKAAETEAVTRRREAKRVLAELKTDEPEKQAVIGGKTYVLPDIQAADVDGGLKKLRAERDKLLKQRGKVEGSLEQLPELEKELAALGEPEPPEPGEIQEWQEALAVNEPILTDLEAKVKGLEHGVPAQHFPAMCAAFADHPCPNSGKVAIPAIDPSDLAEAAKLRADLTEQQDQVKRLQDSLKAAQDKQTAYDAALADKQELTAMITKLQGQQGQAQATAEIDQKVTALDTRIAQGESLKDAVRDFWRVQEAAEKDQARVAQVEAEINLYNALAHALAPDGIPSKLIAEALGPVNDLLDRAAVHFFPGRDLALNENLEIELSGSPFATLSKSAKFRVGIAFQFMLAKLASAGLLMIDEADILDPENRAEMISFLLEIAPEFVSILVFATAEAVKPSQVPEIKTWWVNGGTVRAVKNREAA